MNTLKKTYLLITLFTLSISSAVYSGQDGKWKLSLQFEESETVRHITKQEYQSHERSNFVAEIYFKSPAYFSLGRESDIYGYFARSGYQSIAGRVASGSIGTFKTEPNGVIIFSLYGGDREDIKVTAQALIDCLNDMAYEKFEKVQNELEEYRNEEPELEKSIAQLQKEKEETEEVLARMKKNVQYRSAEYAQKNIQEFDKVIQLVGIEITGIQAKLDMIKQQKNKIQKSSSEYPKGTSELLFQMRLTQEIELAGALARKNAAEIALKNANDFLSLVEKTKQIQETLTEKRKQLSFIHMRIPKLEETLAEPYMGMRPVELVDNKIFIYPIVTEQQ